MDADLAWEVRNRLLVERVLLDYCERVDALDYEGIADLFTEDAEFDMGFGRVSRGRDGVYNQMKPRMETSTPTRATTCPTSGSTSRAATGLAPAPT